MFILKPKTKKPIIKNSAVYAIDILHKPFIAILFIVGLVQVMIFSGNNSIGIVGMIETLASIMKGSSIIFLSPLVGAFGAFMAGSATVSSILFGNFQYLAATNAGYSV
ncbi:MAG: L-lactate permease, partial [Candidatus Nanoarchaeia archaeon]